MLKRCACKFELKPNSGQAKKISQFAGCNRLVWNHLALARGGCQIKFPKL